METLYHDPRHPYTRLLFAAIPDPLGDKDVTSIPGAPPRLDRDIVGCPFRPRCDVAIDRCVTERPAPIWLDERHRAACHRNDEARAAMP
jgi:peptide/nickel transport system ATP-binding protein